MLEERTGINHSELVRCAQFYNKYPNRDYLLKAWREHVKELPLKPDSEQSFPTSKYRCIVVDPCMHARK
jgi:hypothetical protein